MELYFAWHFDADDDIERALIYDKVEEAAKLGQGVEAANRVLESWVLRSHGRIVTDEGTSGSAQMSAEYLEELSDILRQVEEVTGSRMFVGVGSESSEAIIARKVAEKRGGDPAITLYTPDLSEEAREADEMSDGEANEFEVGDGGGGGDDDTGLAKAEGGPLAVECPRCQAKPGEPCEDDEARQRTGAEFHARRGWVAGKRDDQQPSPHHRPGTGRIRKAEGCVHCGSSNGYDRTHIRCVDCGKSYRKLSKAEDNQQEGGEATQVAQGKLSPSAAAPSPPPSPGISAGSPSPQQGQPQPGGQPPTGGQPSEEDVMGAVGQALEQFKAQVPFFEQQVKKANPQAYAAVMGMVQGLIALAQTLAGGDAEGTPPAGAAGGGMQKAEASKVEMDPSKPPLAPEVLRKLYDGAQVEKGEASPTGAHYREFVAGFEHEAKEHPHLNAEQAALTAKQHLAEDPQYYSKLGLLEESGVIGEGSEPLNKVVLPVGSQGVGAHGRSIKVKEPVTGKEVWHQMATGRKLSGDGHALSTKVGECPSADTPESRASKAGLVGTPTTAEEKPPQTAQLPGK